MWHINGITVRSALLAVAMDTSQREGETGVPGSFSMSFRENCQMTSWPGCNRGDSSDIRHDSQAGPLLSAGSGATRQPAADASV